MNDGIDLLYRRLESVVGESGCTYLPGHIEYPTSPMISFVAIDIADNEK